MLEFGFRKCFVCEKYVTGDNIDLAWHLYNDHVAIVRPCPTRIEFELKLMAKPGRQIEMRYH